MWYIEVSINATDFQFRRMDAEPQTHELECFHIFGIATSVPASPSSSVACFLLEQFAPSRDALGLLCTILQKPTIFSVLSRNRITDENQSLLIVNSARNTDPATGSFGIVVPTDPVESFSVYKTPYDASLGSFSGGLTTIQTKMPAPIRRWTLKRIAIFGFRSLEGRTARAITCVSESARSTPSITGTIRRLTTMSRPRITEISWATYIGTRAWSSMWRTEKLTVRACLTQAQKNA